MASPTADPEPDPEDVDDPVASEPDELGGEPHLADGDALPGDERCRYVFDSAHVALAVELIDAAYAGNDDDFSRVHAILEQAGLRGLDRNLPLVRELEAIASYRLTWLDKGKAGAELTSIGFERPAWPPGPRSVEPDVVALWDGLSTRLTEPAALARVNDLLFESRNGNGRDRAQRAAEAYVTVGSARPVDFEQLHSLARAWMLARTVKLEDIDAEVRRQMTELAHAALGIAHDLSSGMLLPPLEVLAEGPLDQAGPDPIDTDGILTAAAQAVSDGEDCTIIAGLRRARTTDPEERDGIIDDEIDGYFRQAARPDDSFRRVFFLERASRRARQLGRLERAREAAAELQRVAPTIRYHTFRQEFSLPRYMPESYLAGFTRSSDWRDGLRYFFFTASPTGTLAAIDEQATSRRGILDSVRSVSMGGHGLPRATTDTEADELASRRDRIAKQNAGQEGLQLSIGLDRMKVRYGTPSEDQIVTLVLEGGASDPRLARSFAKALRHYWAGDYESSIHLVAPKIEAAMRNVLCELDEGIYRVEIGDSAGGYPGLHSLLAELEGLALDESWAYFLRWLFLGPFGANLRNEVAHGYVQELSPPMAALALRALAMLVVVAGPPTYDRVGDDLGDPPFGEPPLRTTVEVKDLLKAPLGPPDRGDRVLGLISQQLDRALWRVEGLRVLRRMRR